MAVAASEPFVDAATPASAQAYTCGNSAVTVRVAGAALELAVDGEVFVLEHVPAASGARYRDAEDTLFWSHGRRALLELRGRRYPECTRADTPGERLAGASWVVEDINGGGIIDRSHVTLAFGDAGRLAGAASCNRYSASYALDGRQLTVAALTTTRMACPPALMMQEQRFLDTLAGVRHFDIDASGALVLAGENGREILARRP